MKEDEMTVVYTFLANTTAIRKECALCEMYKATFHWGSDNTWTVQGFECPYRQ